MSKYLASLALLAALFSLPAGALEYESQTFRGRIVLLAVPENPRALLYLFHGTGGSAKYASRLHTALIAEALYGRGYALVAAESERIGRKKWNLKSANPDSNTDLRDMIALRDHLIASTAVREDTPVFTMGMSNGGGFSSLFGYVASTEGVPVRGIANYMGPVPLAAKQLFDQGIPFPPYFVVLAEQDGLVNSTRVAEGVEQIDNSGTSTELHLATETSTNVSSLVRLGKVSETRAHELVAFLQQSGFIDEKGARLFHANDPITRGHMVQIGKAETKAGLSRTEFNALLIVWGGHQMRSDYLQQQMDFFEQHIAATP